MKQTTGKTVPGVKSSARKLVSHSFYSEMKSTAAQRVLKYGLTIFAACLVCLWPAVSGAQSAAGPSHNGAQKPPTLSFVSPDDTPAGKAASMPAAYAAADQGEADAILADSLSNLLEQTDAHFHEGEYRHIVNLSRIIVQGDPHNVAAYGNSAWLLWSSDRNPEAIDFLKQGIAANPNTYYLFDELGAHYLMHLHDPQSALPYYEKAASLKCPFSTYHGLANCYEKLQMWDKAVKAWEMASVFPDDLLAPVRLKRARAHITPVSGS